MDKEVAHSYLSWLYGSDFPGNIWIGGHGNWTGARFKTVDAAVDYAAARDRVSVYHRLTTLNDTASGRGSDEDSVMLPAFMLDLDLRGPNHKADTYPETFDQLLEILDDAGAPEASAWVNSGGGRYPVWKAHEGLVLPSATTDEPAFRALQELPRRLKSVVLAAGEKRGFKLDNTSDFARVYRLPGSTNRKNGNTYGTAWAKTSEATYDLHELIAKLNNLAPAARIYSLGEIPTSAEVAAAWQPAAADAGWSQLLDGVVPKPAELRDPAEPRNFTQKAAVEFVEPFLAKLRVAQDGHINNTLNDAAKVMAHFGPEFWDAEAMERVLYAALDSTEYDGVSWDAMTTINSARRSQAKDWRATLVPDVVEAIESFSPEAVAAVAPDVVDALIAEMMDVGEMIKRPTPKFLVRGLLQLDSESWLIGPPGSKKSFLAFDLAARVSRGEPWYGRRTNACDVVMIVAEGAGGAGKRGDAWVRTYGEIENMRILARPVQVTGNGGTDWAVLVAACGRLADRAAERGRGLLVVIDTQARVTVGLEENSAKEMGVYIEGVRAIRERTGGCVLTVHHTGRQGGDARGSSAIDGAQTTELKIMSEKGSLTGKLTSEKQKDMEPAEDIEVRFKVVPLGLDDDGEAKSSLVVVEPSGWEDAEAGPDVEAAREQEDPYGRRGALDSWIVQTVPGATLQWWIVQALVDTTEELGLTESGVKEIVTAKRGKQAPSSWRKAWQKVANTTGQWSDVVIPAKGEKWTIDRVALDAKLVG